jgi:hypothetical protein
VELLDLGIAPLSAIVYRVYTSRSHAPARPYAMRLVQLELKPQLDEHQTMAKSQHTSQTGRRHSDSADFALQAWLTSSSGFTGETPFVEGGGVLSAMITVGVVTRSRTSQKISKTGGPSVWGVEKIGYNPTFRPAVQEVVVSVVGASCGSSAFGRRRSFVIRQSPRLLKLPSICTPFIPSCSL